jgi:hypothetical protein
VPQQRAAKTIQAMDHVRHRVLLDGLSVRYVSVTSAAGQRLRVTEQYGATAGLVLLKRMVVQN